MNITHPDLLVISPYFSLVDKSESSSLSNIGLIISLILLPEFSLNSASVFKISIIRPARPGAWLIQVILIVSQRETAQSNFNHF